MALLSRLEAELSVWGWGREDSFSIQIAVEEAVANAYRHGNDEGKLGDVDICWKISHTEFWMQVRDRGPGFDASDVPDPRAPENLEKSSGRGLLLIRGSMTEVEHLEGGRLVVMRKSRGFSKPAPGTV